jgi:hypothetical protein
MQKQLIEQRKHVFILVDFECLFATIIMHKTMFWGRISTIKINEFEGIFYVSVIV